MNDKEYTVDEIKLLDIQLAVKKVLNKYDRIFVSDDDFTVIQEILVKNNIVYSSIRDPELKISTLIVVYNL